MLGSLGPTENLVLLRRPCSMPITDIRLVGPCCDPPSASGTSYSSSVSMIIRIVSGFMRKRLWASADLRSSSACRPARTSPTPVCAPRDTAEAIVPGRCVSRRKRRSARWTMCTSVPKKARIRKPTASRWTEG